MRNQAIHRCAIVLVSLLWTAALSAADRATVKEFITEPATLVSLRFEWRIEGDDNRNAAVSVSYRVRQGISCVLMPFQSRDEGARSKTDEEKTSWFMSGFSVLSFSCAGGCVFHM